MDRLFCSNSRRECTTDIHLYVTHREVHFPDIFHFISFHFMESVFSARDSISTFSEGKLCFVVCDMIDSNESKKRSGGAQQGSPFFRSGRVRIWRSDSMLLYDWFLPFVEMPSVEYSLKWVPNTIQRLFNSPNRRAATHTHTQTHAGAIRRKSFAKKKKRILSPNHGISQISARTYMPWVCCCLVQVVALVLACRCTLLPFLQNFRAHHTTNSSS